jgi:osmotically-inducible protein OsmY
MSDTTLQIAVMTALADNPVVHADEIAAQVHGGDVVLRGTVGTPVQKAEATRVTRAVPGVHRVDDQLGVRPMGIDGRAKADTEAAIFDALDADERVHAGDIDVDVRDDGAVTLRGIVEHADQRDAAERIVLAVPGVESVHNELGVLVQVSADDVAERVTAALGIQGVVGAEQISVRVHDTDVTLTGTVRSHEHHDAAITAAASATGVTSVHDELSIEERC